jgi:hypothetical protein
VTESERQEVWERRAMKIWGLGRLALIIVLASANSEATEVRVPKVVVYLGATLIDGTDASPRTNMAIVTRGERVIGVLSVD